MKNSTSTAPCIKVERKATIELLNDATFLLEAHVIQPEDASTPLRQLYFVLQTQLMERDAAPLARRCSTTCRRRPARRSAAARCPKDCAAPARWSESGRVFEAMKTMRGLFPLEAEMMKDKTAARRGRSAAANRDIDHDRYSPFPAPTSTTNRPPRQRGDRQRAR